MDKVQDIESGDGLLKSMYPPSEKDMQLEALRKRRKKMEDEIKAESEL